MRRFFLLAGLIAAVCAPASVSASETIAYSYDARGRLIKVARSGTVNNGVTACYSYDKADNRINVATASTDCGTGGTSALGVEEPLSDISTNTVVPADEG